jgi:methyl-accepting chemotaxis protein
MAKITASELQELKDSINDGFKEVNQQFTQINQNFTQINQNFIHINQQIENLRADNAQLSEKIQRVETSQIKVSEEMKCIELGQAKIEGRLEEWKRAIDKIPDLAEKMGELKNWRQIAFIVITATFSGIIGWFIRSNNFNP